MSLNCFIGPTRRHIISSTKALWLIRRFEGICGISQSPSLRTNERSREIEGWWQVTLKTESSSARVWIPQNTSDGRHHHTSYLVCIPYHTSFNLIKPWGCSENGDSGSRGSVREWAAWVSSGNCECLWQGAGWTDGDTKVCQEKLSGTRVQLKTICRTRR